MATSNSKFSIKQPNLFNQKVKAFDSWMIFLIGFLTPNIIAFAVSMLVQIAKLPVSSIYLTAIVNLVAQCVSIMAILLFMKKRKTDVILTNSMNNKKMFIYAVIFFISLMVAQQILGIIVTKVQEKIGISGENNNEQLINLLADNYPGITFMTTVLAAPLVEELTFRLGLCEALSKKSIHVGVILSALLFAFMHFDFTCFFPIEGGGVDTKLIYNELLHLPIYIVSGLLLGYAYELSGSLSASYFVHLANNFMAMMSMFALGLLESGATDSTSTATSIILKLFTR